MQPKEDYIRWMWNAYYKLGIIIVILKESLDKLHVTSIESIHCLFVPKGNELNELNGTIDSVTTKISCRNVM